MKKRLVRALEFLLVMCLILNNCIDVIPFHTFLVNAATVASAENVGTVSGNDASVSGNEPSVSGGDVSVSDGNADTPTPESTIEPTVEPSAEPTVEPTAEPTAAPTLQPIIGPVIGPVKQPQTSISVQNSSNYVTNSTETGDKVSLPTNLDDYLDAYNNGAGRTTFYITTYDEFLAAQELCKEPDVNGFYGVTLVVFTPPTSGDTVESTWDIAEKVTDFTGIGTSDYPFQGTMYCSHGQNVLIELATPLFAFLGEGANIYDLSIKSADAHAAIAENVTDVKASENTDVSVTLNNLLLSGTYANAEGSTGIIAANVLSGSNVSVTNVVTSGSITVTGANAGALAGTIAEEAVVTLGDGVSLGSAGNKVVVTGSAAAGGHYGVVTGSQTWDLTVENTKLFVSVVGADSSAYAGGFTGKLNAGTEASVLTINGGNIYTADVSGAGSGGGLVGMCTPGTSLAIPAGFEVTGTVDMGTTGNVGGLIGLIEGTHVNDACMEIKDCTVSATVTGAYAGGIVGGISYGKEIIGDVTIIGSVNGSSFTGGVIGQVDKASAVELQGTIDVLNCTISGAGQASVVGKQNISLIYFAESEGKIDGVNQLKAPIVADDIMPVRLEINSYGGVFRNQTLSSGKRLIGDGTLANVGVVNNTITKSGDWYMLGEDGEIDAAADIETLSIALYTNGNYGNSAFVDSEGWSYLLSSSYQLNSSADISYEKTGIITINRQDRGGTENAGFAFCGKLAGVNDQIKITQNLLLYRYSMWNLGLFRMLGDGAEFSNLIIDGMIRLGTYAGGLAVETVGSSLTLNNIRMERSFVECDKTIGGIIVNENYSKGTFTLNANNVTLASNINTGLNNISGFITTMKDADINMNGVTLGGSMKSSSGSATGGFLGKSWTDVGGTISNITVEQGTIYDVDGQFGTLLYEATSEVNKRLTLNNVKLENLTVEANSGKSNCSLLIQNAQELILEVIDYDSTGCVVNNPGSNFDEIVGVSKESSSPLKSTGIISIHNTASTTDTNPYCFPSYHYENKVESLKGMLNPYTTYFYDVFQRLDDAAGTLDKTLDSETEVLLWDIIHYAVSGNVWNTFNNYFTTDAKYGEYNDIWKEEVQFSGSLDLSKISFYPVIHVSGQYDCSGLNAVIFFDASKFKNWTMNNINESSQHYALNAGLFCDAGYIAARYITLTGNIANLGSESGALVCGERGLGHGDIHYITLDNLWICDYTANQSEPGAGLLISNIPAPPEIDEDTNEPEEYECVFRNIEMTGYENAGDKKAAAALIGSAGSTDTDNLILDFKRMKIADDRDDSTQTHNGKVLAYASFLYNYTYTDTASINEGYGLYLFDVAFDKAGYVTYGEELDFDTEFSDTTNKVFVAGEDAEPATVYKPYVYQVKDIEVNPKSGDILKGCGTYEDPYIIENYRQFLTLYRYINETGTVDDYQYQTFYEGWKVIAIGDDSKFCSDKHRVSVGSDGSTLSGTGVSDVKVFTKGLDNGFPTPDQMSRAYYMLAEDIDLSKKMSSTYEMIAADFVGFGTEERPFVGVWYGRNDNNTDDTSDDVIYKVTLPNKTGTNAYETYGFIQYAKGAVVKDMMIATADNTGETDITAKIKTAGGAVIACILGGDNIIDNVVVDAEFTVSHMHTVVGGFVGNVKKGGLILRNISNDALVALALNTKNAEKGYDTNSSGNKITITDTCEHIGAVVGKVEDGYVLYDGSGDTTNMIWNGTGGNQALVQVPGYNVLNGDALKANTAGLSVAKTSVTENEETKITITYTIPTASALQVMSMALNSDALNIRPSTYMNYSECGYTEISRSRKAAYSDIGCTGITADYTSAVKYDNANNYPSYTGTNSTTINPNEAFAYPYLYNYMGITNDNYAEYIVVLADNGAADGDATQIVAGTYSVLNTGIVLDKKYYSQWNLAESSSYDMSVYNTSFRGIGALYGTYGTNHFGTRFGGTFHGDFDGNGSTIKIDYQKVLLGADKVRPVDESTQKSLTYNPLTRTGLFNVLYERDASLYRTSVDFHNADEESGLAENLVDCATIKDFTLTGNILVDKNSGLNGWSVGGIVADIIDGDKAGEDANYYFENITIKDFNMDGCYSNNHRLDFINGGGMIAGLGRYACVFLNNCSIDNVVVYGGSNLGGFIASAGANKLKFLNCKVDHLCTLHCTISNLETITGNGATNAGGFLGLASSVLEEVIIMGTAENTCSVINSDIRGHATTGGFIGATNCNVSATYLEISDSKLIGYKNIGGIIGHALGGDTTSIMNTNVTNIIAFEVNLCDGNVNGIGGVIGRNEQVTTIKNLSVSGSKSGDIYQCKLFSSNNKARNASNGYGGLVGCHVSNVLTLIDCTVDTVYISADQSETPNTEYTARIGAGGLVGYVGSSVVLGKKTLADGTTTDSTISTNNLYIVAPLREEINVSRISAAGGAFGFVTENGTISGEITISVSNDKTVYSYAYYNGLTASANYIRGKQAGGLIGHINMISNIRLDQITVSNGVVTSDELAGGFVGYFAGGWNGNAIGNSKNEKTNLITDMDIIGRYVGGVVGYYIMRGAVRLEGFAIVGNRIVASQELAGNDYSAGGVFGYVNTEGGSSGSQTRIHGTRLSQNTVVSEVTGSTLTETELNNVSAGGLIGKTSGVGNENTKFCTMTFSLASLDNTNKIGLRVKNSLDVLLVKNTGENYQLSSLTAIASEDLPVVEDNKSRKAYEVVDALEDKYGYFVGNMIGVMLSDNFQVMILRPDDSDGANKFVTPVMELNPPVVDVGRNREQTIDRYRQYCHVVYGATVEAARNASANLADMKNAVDLAKTDYAGNETLSELLQKYRLTKESIETFDKVYQDSYGISETDTTSIPLPLLVYMPEYGSLKEVMDHVVNIMTNVAGNSATDIIQAGGFQLLKISYASKIYNTKTGVISSGTEEASLVPTLADGVTTYVSNRYDNITDGMITYTELTFEYSCGDSRNKVFRLPVFVEEPILYSVHMKMMEGKVRDADTIRTKGISESSTVSMANDSDYTMLFEYTYSDARSNMHIATEKYFAISSNNVDKEKYFAENTRLMLIDVQNGNKAYYYTVTNETTARVDFSDFKDSTGTYYSNALISSIKDIAFGATYTDLAGHTLSGDVGVEQFLLTVITPASEGTNDYYNIHTGIDVDAGYEDRFIPTKEGGTHLKTAKLTITGIPGLHISFSDSGQSIKGTISRESELLINASIVFVADDTYLAAKQSGGMIDSSNAGKYLDMAFYLRDGATRIKFPAGTNFSYKLGDGSYSELKVIPDDAVFYYYKDIGLQYEIADISSQMTTIPLEFVFNFSGADLSNITEETYNAYLELLRTSNPEYPMGSGNQLDMYVQEVKSDAVPELGFAVRATDLTQLGINTYPIAGAQNIINYNVMFDFSTFMKRTTDAVSDVLSAQWAGYNYTVTYKLYKKTENSNDAVVYEEYTGDDIQISAMNVMNNSEVTALDDISMIMSENGELQKVYNFTSEQIKTGFVSAPCVLTVNTAELTADLSALTNYKLVATLTISQTVTDDGGNKIENSVMKDTVDFFVFTITRLKTDL